MGGKSGGGGGTTTTVEKADPWEPLQEPLKTGFRFAGQLPDQPSLEPYAARARVTGIRALEGSPLAIITLT